MGIWRCVDGTERVELGAQGTDRLLRRVGDGVGEVALTRQVRAREGGFGFAFSDGVAFGAQQRLGVTELEAHVGRGGALEETGEFVALGLELLREPGRSNQHGCRVSSGSAVSCHHQTSCRRRLCRARR